jgi:hypothetical protein
MTNIFRVAVVVACYLLSSYGILFSLMPVGMFGDKSLSGAIGFLLTIFAWVCHFIMSINWVLDRRSKKWILVCGTAAGTLGLLFWPFTETIAINFEMGRFFFAVAMRIGFVLPCFLLAIFLVWFHIKADAARHEPSVS